MSFSFPLRRPFIIFALAAAPTFAAIAATPLRIESLSIYEVSAESGQIVLSSETVIPIDDPRSFAFGIGRSLPPFFEMRAKLKVDEGGPEIEHSVLSMHFGATYSIFWDNERIGRNGIVDSNGDEIEIGRSHKTFALPGSLKRGGTHLLAIRGAHSHTPQAPHWVFVGFQTLEEKLNSTRWLTITYALFLGFALFGVYLLVGYALKRDQFQFLLLGLSCLFFGLYAVNKLVYFQLNVQYVYLDWIGLAGKSVHIAFSLSAPAAVLYILGYRRWAYYGFLLLPYVLSIFFGIHEIVPLTLYVCLGIAGLALFQVRKYAFQSIFVLGLLAATYKVPFLAQHQTFGFGVLMAYVFVSIIVLLNKQYQDKTRAELRNSRLQLELLKSKVQPHFVLNSLTSAMEWIETNPKAGVKLIQALAKEFELLSDISEKREIPIATEVESCRTYLKIMEYRKKAEYTLQLENVRLDEQMPPSILRNLLENALTHNAYQQRSVVFSLSQRIDGMKRRFRFSSPYALSPNEESVQEGTGIQYIKARLAESYDNEWEFRHGPEDRNWVTEIVMPAQRLE